jgi:hypothetical protein
MSSRPALDVSRVQRELTRFIRRHRTRFNHLASKETQLLEMASLAIAAEHYARANYTVFPVNPINGTFKVKTSSKGYRSSFSWFRAEQATNAIEIHANLGVQSAYRADTGIYVVDVGVIKADALSFRGPGKTDEWVANKDLITFLEAKHLTAYPMLLAQFVGMVHEISPRFISSGSRPRNFRRDRHFNPALLTVGPLARTARAIHDGFRERGLKIQVVSNLDVEISWLGHSHGLRSPLDDG